MTELIDETEVEYDVVLVPEEQAHIVFPQVEAGVKALALCGKVWKPKFYNGEVPLDYFTCPDCVTGAVSLLVEAHQGVVTLTKRLDLIQHVVTQTFEEMSLDIPNLLDTIESGEAFREQEEQRLAEKSLRRAEKAEAKAAKAEKKGKKKKK